MSSRARRLPPLPKTVYTALGSVPVERRDCLDMEAQTDEGKVVDVADATLLGTVDFTTRTITVRNKLAPSAAWHTLEHERVHLALWDGGVKLPTELEELICDVIASARVAEMVARLSPPSK